MEQNRPPADEGHHKDETHDGEAGEAGRHHAQEPQPQHDKQSQREKQSHHDRQVQHDRNAKILWRLLVASIFIVPILLLALSFQLRGTRYVMAQLKGMKFLFGEPTFLLWHLATYISVGVGPWLLRRHGRNRMGAI